MKKYVLFVLFLIIIGCNKIKPVPIEMVLVEAGEFKMGSNDGNQNEKPVHKVKITKPFYIGKYEITFEQYDSFCVDTDLRIPYDRGWGRENRPVILVNWENMIDFCNWLSKKEGLVPCYTKIEKEKKFIWKCDFNANGYRLPTEAEWEYAARGGNNSKNYKYSGSNNPDETAWYGSNSENMTHPVGEKKPNELGIYDMSGNVFERCWDMFGNYTSDELIDPSGPEKGFERVVKGGSWAKTKLSLSTIYRSNQGKGFVNNDLGFRVVRNAN